MPILSSAATAIDSILYRDAFGTPAMRALFADGALIGRYVEVEVALARAEARCGVIPSAAAQEIAAKADPAALDLDELRRGTDNVGYPIPSLVHQLAAQCGEAGRWLHWGATTQDIMDTAVVLQIRDALALVEADVGAVRTILAGLAQRYRDTPMAGRTHLQHALPITFGDKAAVWLSMFDRHAERLEQLKPRVLVGQFAGAAGTLAYLVLSFYALVILFIVGVLGSVCAVAGLNIFRLLSFIREEIYLVLGTASSESALPRLLERLPQLGCSRQSVGLVLPTGYAFNLDGTAIFTTMSTVFMANAYDVPLSWAQELGLVAVMLLTSKGAATVSGGSFVVFAATIPTTGVLPIEGLPILFGIYRFLSIAVATTNVIGNSIAAVVTAKLCGEFQPMEGADGDTAGT